MLIEVSFPGGQSVDAHLLGHTVHTDQPVKAGGDGSGPAPFDLFLASIATCMGLHALSFCQRRNLGSDGLRLTMKTLREPDSTRIGTIRVTLALPAGFPAKYLPAVRRAMDQCAVKRHLFDPPEFEVETEIGA